MHVLVTAASRHGSTADIADALADGLSAHGLEATVLPPDRVESADGFDAVVVGSALYVGHWLPEATALVRRCSDALAGCPVWLFSSGPVGAPNRRLVRRMTADPLELPELLRLTGAREHRIFAGRLVAEQLSRVQRLALPLFPGLRGDFRDWGGVGRWSAEIAGALREAGGDAREGPRVGASA